MTRRAIVLIGTEKTGTTTLQNFLALNRKLLVERGFFYPGFCGETNHTGLAAYALAPCKTDDIRAPFGYDSPADLTAMRARLLDAARVELVDRAETTIFCSEHCHSRLNSAEEIATLHGLLSEFFDDIQIAIYLRRQDQVALSLYSTQLKSGAVHSTILPRTDASDTYFNHDRTLAMWAAEFGKENLHPRVFDRASMIGGSVLTDFCAAWGIGAIEGFRQVADFNGSISGMAQVFLRHANQHLATADLAEDQRLRGMLAARLETLFPGRGARPSRAAAWAFYAQFRPSNELVRRTWLPQLPRLFDENFDIYPEQDDPITLTVEDATLVAMRLHAAAMAEMRRLEAEIALRDGRMHWHAKRPGEAVAALRRARQLRPDHPEILRTLAEYLFHSAQFSEASLVARAAAERRPEMAEYWHFLGLALRRAGDPAAAARAQEKVLEITPDDIAARRELELVAAICAPVQPGGMQERVQLHP